MAQADIHRTRDGRDLVCRVQSDLGVDTPYILCAPVLPRADWGALVPRLHIPIDLGQVPHVILMSQLIALPATELGPVTGTAAPWHDEIIAAIDLLVSGF